MPYTAQSNCGWRSMHVGRVGGCHQYNSVTGEMHQLHMDIDSPNMTSTSLRQGGTLSSIQKSQIKNEEPYKSTPVIAAEVRPMRAIFKLARMSSVPQIILPSLKGTQCRMCTQILLMPIISCTVPHHPVFYVFKVSSHKIDVPLDMFLRNECTSGEFLLVTY